MSFDGFDTQRRHVRVAVASTGKVYQRALRYCSSIGYYVLLPTGRYRASGTPRYKTFCYGFQSPAVGTTSTAREGSTTVVTSQVLAVIARALPSA